MQIWDIKVIFRDSVAVINKICPLRAISWARIPAIASPLDLCAGVGVVPFVWRGLNYFLICSKLAVGSLVD